MRVLFAPVNILSSMTRQVLVARALRDRGHQVVFGGDGEYLRFARDEGFDVAPLRNIDIKKFVAKIQGLKLNLRTTVQWIAESLREFDLERMVEDELALFREVGPDLFITEERPTTVISCLIAGIPHVGIRNAYRTQYSSHHLADFSVSVVSKIFSDPMRAQQSVLRLASIPFMHRFNRILRRHGSGERMTFDRYMSSDDLVCMCDIPEFAPTTDPPESFRYVGPLVWRSTLPAPPWLDALPEGRRALYVSLGSTGTPELFDTLIGQLARADRPLVITTGYQIDREALAGRDGVYIEDLVNADEVLPRCGLVICHGGNGTVYQSLRHGLPCIGVPTHLEQRYNCRRLETMDLGGHLELDAIQDDPTTLPRLVDRLLSDEGVASRLRTFRSEMAGWDAPSLAADRVEELLRRSR